MSDLDWLSKRVREAGVPQPGAEYDMVGMLTDPEDALSDLRTRWESPDRVGDTDLELDLARLMGRYRLPWDQVVLLPAGEDLSMSADGRVVESGTDRDALFRVSLDVPEGRVHGRWANSQVTRKVLLEPHMTEMITEAGTGSATCDRLLMIMAFSMSDSLNLRISTITVLRTPGGDRRGSVELRVTMARPPL